MAKDEQETSLSLDNHLSNSNFPGLTEESEQKILKDMMMARLAKIDLGQEHLDDKSEGGEDLMVEIHKKYLKKEVIHSPAIFTIDKTREFRNPRHEYEEDKRMMTAQVINPSMHNRSNNIPSILSAPTMNPEWMHQQNS